VTAPGQRVTENYLIPVIFQNERVTVIGRYPLNKYGALYARAAPKGTDPDIRAYCAKFFSED